MVRKRSSSVEKRPTQPPLRSTDPAESTLLALLCVNFSLVEQRAQTSLPWYQNPRADVNQMKRAKIRCGKKISIGFPCEGTMTNKPSLFSCDSNRRHRFVPNCGRLCLHQDCIPRASRMSLGMHDTTYCIRTEREEKSLGSNCSSSSHFLRVRGGKRKNSSQIETRNLILGRRP